MCHSEGARRSKQPFLKPLLRAIAGPEETPMVIPAWLIHAAFLSILAALVAVTYLGLEFDLSGAWASTYQRGWP